MNVDSFDSSRQLLNKKRAASIKRIYNNYEATYGIEISSGTSSFGFNYDLYCKVKLKNPPKVPFYFKNDLFLGGNDYLKHNWLYTYRYEYSGFTKKLKEYFDNSIGKFLEKQLPRIKNKDIRVDTGELKIDKFISRGKKDIKENILILTPIIIIIITITYILFDRGYLWPLIQWLKPFFD